MKFPAVFGDFRGPTARPHNSPARKAGYLWGKIVRAEGPRYCGLCFDAGLQPAWIFVSVTQPDGLGYYESGRWPIEKGGSY